MTPTITPRPHAELRDLTDAEYEAIFNEMPGGPRGFCIDWGYLTFGKRVLEVARTPAPPPEPRMIEWMGERFQLPLTKAPIKGEVWVAEADGVPSRVGPYTLRPFLEANLVHLREEDAAAHSRALKKANEQAIRGGGV